MNTSQRPMIASPEAHLIADALEGLRQSTGITGKILPEGSRSDARVSLHVAGKSLQYHCEVKQKIDRFMTLNDLKARSVVDGNTILVSRPLTSAIAARCQELDIQFIDTAGNAFITDNKGVLISVTGRKPGKDSLVEPRDSTITPAALRMVFGFLADPSMLNAPYRQIAQAVQVSTGAIAKAFATLETRGFIGTTPDGRRLIRSPELLLSEWATGYINRLRPKLRKFRFSAPDTADMLNRWSPEFRVSAWGGEVGAEKITGHLNPATFTLYMDMRESHLTELVKRFRLRADPQGAIEVLQPFWDMDKFAESFPTVPLHVVYADLLATHDSRNLKVAEQIFDKVVTHVHDSQR